MSQAIVEWVFGLIGRWMNSVLYDVSYVGLGNTKMGYYLPFHCWREVSFIGHSASIQHKHFFFLHQRKFPGLILRSQNSWGSLETQSRKGLRGYQEWHNSYKVRRAWHRKARLSQHQKTGREHEGNACLYTSRALSQASSLLWSQVLLTHRCRLRVEVFSGAPESCGLTDSVLLMSPRLNHFSITSSDSKPRCLLTLFSSRQGFTWAEPLEGNGRKLPGGKGDRTSSWHPSPYCFKFSSAVIFTLLKTVGNQFG